MKKQSAAAHYSNTPLLHCPHLHRRHRHRRHSFAPTERAHPFVRRRLDADARGLEAKRSRDLLAHRGNVRRDFRRFRDQRCVHIQRARVNLSLKRRYPLQNLDAADPANRFVVVWKMMTDVVFADRAQQRIRDRVADHVRVRMPVESALVRNLDTAQDQFASGREPMRVVTISAADRAHSFKSITPFQAMMLYLSFMSVRGFISTVPPAVSTRIHPAAMSHRLMPCSM